ncbi:MAG: FIVAR domain-containing protein, partial [Oscillospiraceae bacterium]|nr:FIVAR domain-containing protein [Oscillospiraceae bacterium]
MKKPFRLFCVLLAMLLISGTVAVGVQAAVSPDKLKYNNTDMVEITHEQSATMLLDFIDLYLADIGDVITNPIPKFTIDYTSIDKAAKTIYETISTYKNALDFFKPIVGDLAELDVTALNGLSRSKGDLNFVYGIVQFAADNKGTLTRLINGTLNLGSLGNISTSTGKVSDMNAVFNGIPDMIKDLIYTSFVYNPNYGDSAYTNRRQDSSEFKNYTADRLVNRMLTDMLTKPQTNSGGLASAFSMLSNVSSFLNMGSFSASQIEGAVLLPSLAKDSGLLNMTNNTFYQLIENILDLLYKDALAPMLNSTIKAMFCDFADVSMIPVTDSAVKAKLASEDKSVNSAYADAYFGKSPSNGNKYFYRDGKDYFIADFTGANKLSGIINWDYNFGPGEFSFKNSGDPIGTLNKFVCFALNKMFKGLNLVNGDNKNLNANIEKFERAVLPLLPEKYFPDSFNMSKISASAVKNMNIEEMTVYFLRAVISVAAPYCILPDDMTTMEQFLAVLLREGLSATVPHLNYDDKIFSSVEKRVLKSQSDAAWTDIIMTMVVDVVVYVIDQGADLKMNAAKVKELKGKGWQWIDFLDEIINWGLGYVDGLFAAAKPLNYDRNYQSGARRGGPETWKKINVLLNSLIPLDFINDVSKSGYTCEFEDFVMKKLIGNLLNMDVYGIANIFRKNSAPNNIFNMKAVPGVIYVVNQIINSVFKGAVPNPKAPLTVEDFVSKKNLSALFNGIIDPLNVNKKSVLPTLLPIIASVTVQMGKTNVLQPPVVIFPDPTPKKPGELDSPPIDYYVVNALNGSFTLDMSITNPMSGTPSAFTKDGKVTRDSLYRVDITDITTNLNNVSVSKTKFAPLQSITPQTVTLKGSGAANKLLEVTVKYQIYGKDNSPIASSPFTEKKYLYLSSSGPSGSVGKFNDSDLNSLFENALTANRQAWAYTDKAKFDAYTAAVREAAEVVLRPKNAATFNNDTLPLYKKAADKLTKAINELEKSRANVDGSFLKLKERYDGIMKEMEQKPYSFVDFKVYLFAKFTTQQFAAHNMLTAGNTNMANSALIAETENLLKLTYDRMKTQKRDGGYSGAFLSEAINSTKAQGYAKSKYSAQSWTVYEAALKKAEDVKAKGTGGTVTQTAINNAKNDLQAARMGLISKGNSADYTVLEKAIADANKVKNDGAAKYPNVTKEGWDALNKAIAAANAVNKTPLRKYQQAQIDGAAKSLKDAVKIVTANIPLGSFTVSSDKSNISIRLLTKI